jgi:WD40 repeat protein
LIVQSGQSAINAVALSPDGKLAITAGADAATLVWDVSTGKILRQLIPEADEARGSLTNALSSIFLNGVVRGIGGHLAAVRGVAVSADGRYVLTGGDDATLRIWNIETGKEVKQFEPRGLHGQQPIIAVAFSNDGRFVLAGRKDTSVAIWDVASGKEVRSFFMNYQRAITSVALSPDGRLILLGNTDKLARLWDVATGKEIRRLAGRTSAVTSVAISPDGRLALTRSADIAQIWEIATGNELRRLPPGNTAALAFTPDSRRAFISGTFWDVDTGQQTPWLPRVSVSSLEFSRDGRLALTANGQSSARVWNVETGRQVRLLSGLSGGVRDATISSDGKSAFIAGNDGKTHIWDLSSGREIRSLIGHTGFVQSVALSRDGRLAITGSGDKTARVWDVATGRELRRFDGPASFVHGAVLSPDGRTALALNPQGMVEIRDVATGELVRRFAQSGPADSVAVSPDGRQALTAGADTQLWDVSSGAKVRQFKPHLIPIFGGSNVVNKQFSAAFSADGRFALTGGLLGTAHLWNVATGEEVRQIKGWIGYVASVGFSPDGKLAVTAGNDLTARLWDLATGKEIGRLAGHTNTIRNVSFSPDGRFLISASLDGTARLWDAPTGRELATIVSFDDGSWAVTDPEGRYDASDPGRAVGMYWVAGDAVIDLGQLKQRFYTPGLLARVVGGGITPNVATIRNIPIPPEVEPASVAPGTLNLPVTITNRGGGIGRVVVRVNGREIPASIQGQTIDAAAKQARVTVHLSEAIPRPDGANSVEINAFDKEDLVSSRGVSVEWKTGKVETIPRFYAIVAGASEYSNPVLNLSFAAKDAQVMSGALKVAAEGLFGSDKTDVRLFATGSARPPTKANLNQAFAEIATKAKPADVLVIYLAGHGVTVRGVADRYFYLTPDARSTELPVNDKAALDLMSVSSEELRAWSWRVPALKQVIILDTCAAGAATSDLLQLAAKRDLTPDQRRALELLKDATGSHILMGAAADAVSYETSRYGQGLLTYALLAGLRGPALDEAGRVDVRRWFDYVQVRVQDLARDIGGIQRPQVSSPQGSTFPIGLLTEAARREIPLANAKQQVLRIRCQDANDLDSLRLEPVVRAALRAVSTPVTRGSAVAEPSIVYLDNVVDEVPDAIVPQIRYSVEGSSVRIRLRLVRIREGKQEVTKEQTLIISSLDPTTIAHALKDAILAAVAP